MNRKFFLLLVAVAALAAMALLLLSCGGGGDGGYPLGPGPTPTPAIAEIVSLEGIPPVNGVRCGDVVDVGKAMDVEFHYKSQETVIARVFTRETERFNFDSDTMRTTLSPSSSSRRAFVHLTCPFDTKLNVFVCDTSVYPKDATFVTTTIGVKLETATGQLITQKEMPCTLTWKRIYN